MKAILYAVRCAHGEASQSRKELAWRYGALASVPSESGKRQQKRLGQRQRQWQWRTSVSIDADIAFWRTRGEAAAGLWLAAPALSFGQAQRLKHLLEQESITSATTPEQELSSLISGRSGFPFANLTLQYVDLRSLPEAVFFDETLYRRFMDMLAGRLLLPDDAMALAEYHGFSFADTKSLLRYVQLGWLRGDLTLEAGVSWAGVRWVAAKPGGWRSVVRRLLDGSGLNVGKGAREGSHMACRRCGSERLHRTDCPHCGQDCRYCEECLTMGRVKSCSPLISGVVAKRTDLSDAVGTGGLESFVEPWGLSDAQAAASRAGLAFLGRPAPAGSSEPEAFLIWAVTGAGKTEMIFPFLAAILAKGGRALVATPRKDVVLELSPRIRTAFAEARVVTLYGGSDQRWDEGDIVIATTHQLLRYRHAFDLVVIDELDAFPFHNNPMLNDAARHACKPYGKYILLSATPPAEMQRAVLRGRLSHVKVPVRYHRHPLPVPSTLAGLSLRRMLAARRLAKPLLKAVQASLLREAQLFVFVPGIAFVDPLTALLRRYFSCEIRGTSSKDPNRAEKVAAFREGKTRVLVTTTILERGVTVPKSDVIVLDADSRLFDEASLVQMAGRAGRSKLDPAGKVLFASRDRTQSQARAIRQIRSMNRLARRRGYLIEDRRGR